MEKRQLGRSSLHVYPITFGGNVFGWTADEPSSFAVLDAYVDFLDSRPHFRELALGNRISEWTRESQSDPQTGPGGILGDLLVKKCGWKPGKRLQLRIRIAAEVGDRVIAFAYKQESVEARRAVLHELKEMLTRYLLP